MIQLETELLKVTKYAKHKRFPPEWNRSITFIYDTEAYEEVIKQAYIAAKQNNFEVNEFVVFTATRWYNFHTNDYLGRILDRYPEISLNTFSGQNRGLIVRGDDFDYRCTFYPRQFHLPVDYSLEKPTSLLKWFYLNQNRNVYYGNRIFIIFHDRRHPGASWRLRGMLSHVEMAVANAFGEGLELLEFEVEKDGRLFRPKCAVVFVTEAPDDEQNEAVPEKQTVPYARGTESEQPF
jgi:hypothetical protein